MRTIITSCAVAVSLVAGALVAFACRDADPAEGGPHRAWASGWRADPLWDDGLAEFSVYEVSFARYARTWPGRATLIVVKEPWNPELDVKADSVRPEGFEVLKLNHIRHVPTGIYAYHQMASVFVRRHDGALRKMATSSTEGCGISTSLFRDGRLELRSYFDGQGDRQVAWPAGALPFDGLALFLRDHVTGEAPTSVSIFPSLLTGKFASAAPEEFELKRQPIEAFETRIGAMPAVRIALVRGDVRHVFVFERSRPHRLLMMEEGSGTRYRIAKSERMAYWNMMKPGAETWYPEDLR